MNKNRIKVALANSQLLVRDSISRMLAADARFDICVNTANGEELIRSLSSAHTLPDICVLDVQMPLMNGYETLQFIREHMPGLKVIVLSQLEDEFVVRGMLKLGAGSYLGKECTMQELRHALVKVYETGQYCSELMAAAPVTSGPMPCCLDAEEYTYLKYCHTEMSIKEIACKMNVSPATIKNYRDSLFEKLKVHTRQGLAIFAYKTGIIAPGDLQPHRSSYIFSTV